MLQSVRSLWGGAPAKRRKSQREGFGHLDNLTHSLTGLALSRGGLNRVSAHATLVLVLAANAPDIDVVSAAGGALSYLEYHRHFTHALAAIPLVSLLPALIACAIFRKNTRFWRAYGVSLIGVASHVGLDYTNIYGVRLKLPWSSAWFRLDTLSVVDVWVWTVLLISVLAPALARLVGSEIGAKPRSPHPGRGFPVLALTFLACYIFGRFMLHQRAIAVLESRLYEDTAPIRTAAFPGPFSLFRWKGLVETEQFYMVYEDLKITENFDPSAGRVFYKPALGPEIQAARRTRVFRKFLEFSEFPLWRVVPLAELEGAVQVEAVDLRFGAPPDRRFAAIAILDRGLNVRQAWFQFGVR